MELLQVVEASGRLRLTRSRLRKREILVEVLREAGADLGLVTSYLAGSLPQRRTGLGWSGLRQLPPPADTASLAVAEVDSALTAIAGLSGPGSVERRQAAVAALFGRATAPEQAFLRGLVLGELRQGASDAAMVEAAAEAFGLPLAAVRRAAMLGGDTAEVVVAAANGGAAALEGFELRVGRAVRPMLASSAPTVEAAYQAHAGQELVWDAKLDGIRAQVHRQGDEVWVYTRSLEEITARLPEVVAQAKALPAAEFVLDGEVLLVGVDGRPRPFQETSARTASARDRAQVRFFGFDLLQLDGRVVLEQPLAQRRDLLAGLLPAEFLVRHVVAPEPAEAERFFEEVIDAGLEGVVVKDLQSGYDAGRRGGAWVKVKPRHTFDLVVVAVEWGSGRRRGLLSNIHLAARGGPDEEWVMVGKTFKGMTDEMLAWQTRRFLELECAREGHVVRVRPEQVVEIAVDGVQRSARYPGGVALRFARVVGYRSDKGPDDADAIDSVRALLPS